MKGVSKPILLIEILGTSIVLVGVLLTGTGWTEDYVKRQTLEAKTERVANAAVALDSTREGAISITTNGYYRFKYEPADQLFSLEYQANPETDAGIVENVSFERVSSGYDVVDISGSYQELRSSENSQKSDILVVKKIENGQEVLSVVPGSATNYEQELNT